MWFVHTGAAMVQPENNQPLEQLDFSSIKRILCWVTSMNRRDSSAMFGQSLARQNNAECHIVMGLDSPNQLPGTDSSLGALEKKAPLTPEVISKAERILARLYCDIDHVRTMVLPGHPIQEIRRYARRHQIDLILMGNQGLSVEEKYGERLCESAPCAVIVMIPPQNTHER